MASKYAFQIKGLKKYYSEGEALVKALDGITFDVEQGERFSIMGPSGSGKSTLLHLMGCLDVPTDGELFIDGIPLSELSEAERAEVRRKKIGFVFQQFFLIPSLNVLQNVAMPMMLLGLEKAEREERAAHLLDDLGLANRYHHFPNQLSGGEKQRTAIARALANEPKIIMADEPTGNLDSKSGAEVFKILEKLHKKDGRTIIVVTHERAFGVQSNHVINLRDGQIVKIEKIGSYRSSDGLSK